jgi:hypothetical protein
MRKQTLIALLTAVSVGSVSVTALADDGRDRDRIGGWKIEKQHDRDRDRHRDRDREDRRKAERRKKRHDRDRIVIHSEIDRDRDWHKHKKKPKHKYRDRDKVIVIDRGHRRPWLEHDHYQLYRPWGGRHQRYARVVSVVPIHRVLRAGRHCRSDYGAGDWLELNLGDIIISAGKDRDDCHYLDREIRSHYRVTYRYRGRLHTVRMYRHPGQYVRVNRFGELIRGRR